MTSHNAQKERVGCALKLTGGALAGIAFAIIVLSGAFLCALSGLAGGL